ADRGQDRDQSPRRQPPLCGHESVGPQARYLPRLLRAAWQRTGETDRGTEERLAHGPLVVPSFSRQWAGTLGGHAGLCLGGAASGGDRGVAGSSYGRGEHVAAEAVESGGRGQDQRTADLVPLRGDVAPSASVRAGVPGGPGLRRKSAPARDCRLADSRPAAALVAVPKFRRAAAGGPCRYPAKNRPKQSSGGAVSRFAGAKPPLVYHHDL